VSYAEAARLATGLWDTLDAMEAAERERDALKARIDDLFDDMREEAEKREMFDECEP
jgi:hypothetical protein